TTAPVGLGDFLEQARLVTHCDHAFTWFLTVSGGAAELPGFFTQCKGHKQDTLCCGIMLSVGRCGHGLSPPCWEGFTSMQNQLTNSGLLSQSTRKHSISPFLSFEDG